MCDHCDGNGICAQKDCIRCRGLAHLGDRRTQCRVCEGTGRVSALSTATGTKRKD